jgi:uncharacterized membrane protein (UPF0127 family)
MRDLAPNLLFRFSLNKRLSNLLCMALGAAWFTCGMAQETGQASVEQTAIQAPTFAVGSLSINNKTVAIEIADTQERRIFGLMGRTSLPQDSGMLFVFDEVASTCFWMLNTPLPLSIGFFDEEGVLVSSDDMQPFDESHHCPAKPMKYALEMPQGWFADNQIKEGVRMTLSQ